MIVGAVEQDVYRRIEEHVGKLPAATTMPKADGLLGDFGAVAKSAEKPGVGIAPMPQAAPSPTQAWQSLKPGDNVLTLYSNDKKEQEGWWAATVARIEKTELVLRWPGGPIRPRRCGRK
jgi:hypothetical protein